MTSFADRRAKTLERVRANAGRATVKHPNAAPIVKPGTCAECGYRFGLHRSTCLSGSGRSISLRAAQNAEPTPQTGRFDPAPLPYPSPKKEPASERPRRNGRLLTVSEAVLIMLLDILQSTKGLDSTWRAVGAEAIRRELGE